MVTFYSDWGKLHGIMPNAICGCFPLSIPSVELDLLNYKGKRRGRVWRSGLMAVLNLRPSVCHCTFCCSGRVTAFRASVSVRVQEAAGNAQLRARIHTWKLPSKIPVWSVGHSWVLNAWPRSSLHSSIPRLALKPVEWPQNLLAVHIFSLSKGLYFRRATVAPPLNVCFSFVMPKWHNWKEQTESLSKMKPHLVLVAEASQLAFTAHGWKGD